MFKNPSRRASRLRAFGTSRLSSLAAVLLFVFLLGSPSQAQQQHSFAANLLGGVSGSLDADPDPGWDNPALQLGFSWVTRRRTTVGLRLGTMDFGSDQVDRLSEAELTYLTLAGEYRTTDRFYKSGVFIGLGLYSLDATNSSAPGTGDEDAIGLTAGVTGDFPVADRWSVLVEFAVHWAELDQTQLFSSGLAGVSFHF